MGSVNAWVECHFEAKKSVPLCLSVSLQPSFARPLSCLQHGLTAQSVTPVAQKVSQQIKQWFGGMTSYFLKLNKD